MGLYLGRLIIGRIFASEIWGAYFREGLLLLLLFIFYLLFFFGGGGGRLLSEFCVTENSNKKHPFLLLFLFRGGEREAI